MKAGDIDELVDTKYPVYFNYAEATPESTPKSLKVYEITNVNSWYTSKTF